MIASLGNAGLDAMQLLQKHMEIASVIARILKRRYNWIDSEELYSYSLYALTVTAFSYDASKGVPFPVYAARKAMYLAVDQMRHERVLHRDKPFEMKYLPLGVRGDQESGHFDVEDTRNDWQNQMDRRDESQTLLRRLPHEDRQLLKMYYSDGMTFRQIARTVKACESSVCLRHKKLIGKLRHIGSSRTF